MAVPSFLQLGTFVRQRREALRLTQGVLGAAIGVDQTTISSWEKGEARPRPANLEALAAELHCPVGELRTLAGYPSDRLSTSAYDIDPVVAFYRAHREVLNRQPRQQVLLAVMRALVESDAGDAIGDSLT